MDIPLYEGDAIVLQWGELSWPCRVYRSTERCGTCGGATVRIEPPWDAWQLLCCQEATLTTTVAEQKAAFDTLAPGAIGMVSALPVQVWKT